MKRDNWGVKFESPSGGVFIGFEVSASDAQEAVREAYKMLSERYPDGDPHGLEVALVERQRLPVKESQP